MLLHATVAADNNAFLAGAAALRERLSGGRQDLADALQVAPGVEVRSAGALRLADDWRLAPTVPAESIAAPVVTLRAGGDLSLGYGLQDGFGPSSAANAYAQDGSAASFRLVAGADLTAADPMAVQGTPDSGGDLVIGRPALSAGGTAPAVFLRSTTGDIDLAAARDIRLLNNGVRVYTSGAPVDAGTLPEWARVGLGNNQTLRDGPAAVGPFFSDAGDISLVAGRHVQGSPSRQYVTDWWWRQTSLNAPGTPAAWWSRYDVFQQGVGSFGGGDITVRAGADVLDFEAATPSSGYALRSVTLDDGSSLPAAALTLPGGTLSVQAGGDVVSGLLAAGGPVATLVAGGSIRSATQTGLGQSHPGLQLLYGATRWTLQARGDLTVGHVTNPGLLAGVVQASGTARTDLIGGLDDGAALAALSVAGDLLWAGTRTRLSPSTDPRNISTDPARQAPGHLTLTAAGGSITVQGPLLQRPVGDGRLALLADQTLTVGPIVVGAVSAPQPARPLARTSATTTLVQAWRVTDEAEPTLDRGHREPVRLVSRADDVSITADIRSARPLRVLAGEDIEGSGSAAISIQHQEDGELSLWQAGRDVVLADDPSARITLAGPGDLLILAGRDIDLKRAAGITTIGNQENARLLPEGGARITLVSGVDWDGADYRSALDAGLALAGGGAGLTGFEGELWARLATDDPEAVTTEAAAWRALPAEERTTRVRERVGEVAWAEAVTEAMRRDSGQPDLNAAQAAARWDGLDAPRRAQLQAPLRSLLLAQAGGPESAAAVRSLYDSLPPEQQALRLHDVLFAELRAAGRAAARLPSGPGREAAYAPGYAALSALYPGTRPNGDIRLSASQVKTLQGGDIRLIAPGGAIDAGALAGAGGKRASDLGILTSSGGNIETAARGNFAVNQSRVFTLARGDLLIWSSEGNIDAGRGAKTVTGAPPPVFTIDRDGNVVIDTSGSFSGSGIAVLDADSALDLYAPKGEISAGEAGIASRGIAFIAGEAVRGADIVIAGPAVGTPAKVDASGATAGLASLNPSEAATASLQASAEDDEDDLRKRRRQRRNLLLEFLGFGAAE